MGTDDLRQANPRQVEVAQSKVRLRWSLGNLENMAPMEHNKKNQVWALVWMLLPLLAGCADMPARSPDLKSIDLIEMQRPLPANKGAQAGSQDGNAPRQFATPNGSQDPTHHLTGQSVDRDAQENFGSTRPMSAASTGQQDVAQSQMRKGSAVDTRQNLGSTPSTGAVSNRPQVIVRATLDVNAREAFGITPLMRAAEKGQLDVVKSLVSMGADVNARSEGGVAALLYAVRGGHLEVVDYLVDHGADVNAMDSMGFTPLMLAAIPGKLDIVQSLIEKGADVNAVGDNTFSPLEYAVRGEHFDVAAFLRQRGARE
jgi:ankyrin repeat protein